MLERSFLGRTATFLGQGFQHDLAQLSFHPFEQDWPVQVILLSGSYRRDDVVGATAARSRNVAPVGSKQRAQAQGRIADRLKFGTQNFEPRTNASEAARTSLGRLEQTVDSFPEAVGLAGLRPCHDNNWRSRRPDRQRRRA